MCGGRDLTAGLLLVSIPEMTKREEDWNSRRISLCYLTQTKRSISQKIVQISKSFKFKNK